MPRPVGPERLEERVVLDATPTILGTVFQDLNEDGVPSAGEALAGVAVQLFQDDGRTVCSRSIGIC